MLIFVKTIYCVLSLGEISDARARTFATRSALFGYYVFFGRFLRAVLSAIAKTRYAGGFRVATPRREIFRVQNSCRTSRNTAIPFIYAPPDKISAVSRISITCRVMSFRRSLHDRVCHTSFPVFGSPQTRIANEFYKKYANAY